MSLSEARLRYPTYNLREARKGAADGSRQALTSIVPTHSVSGRALLGVIAIMSLLASLTLGVVVLVRTSAATWQSQVSREITIQIRPIEGRDIDTEVSRAALIVRATPGIAQVKPYSREQSLRLLEPWLGAGLALDDLPIPRLIVVTVAPDTSPNLTRLRQALTEQVAGASLDDHRNWLERMRSMTSAAVAIGFGVLGLVLAATLLMVVFATRSAMATNHGIVEVLHFVGAKNRFIATQFQRQFLTVATRGATFGAGGAMVIFVIIALANRRVQQEGEPSVFAGLFGSLTLSAEGYAGIFGVAVLIAAVTAITTRWTVHRTLANLD